MVAPDLPTPRIRSVVVVISLAWTKRRQVTYGVPDCQRANAPVSCRSCLQSPEGLRYMVVICFQRFPVPYQYQAFSALRNTKIRTTKHVASGSFSDLVQRRDD